jgi:hypothetical protein
LFYLVSGFLLKRSVKPKRTSKMIRNHGESYGTGKS